MKTNQNKLCILTGCLIIAMCLMGGAMADKVVYNNSLTNLL